MSAATLLEEAADLYQQSRLEESHARFLRAKGQVDDKKEFARLLKRVGLSDVYRVLQEHTENDEWVNELKDVYRPLVEHKIKDHIAAQRRGTDPVSAPQLSWYWKVVTTGQYRKRLKKSFWAEREEKWREEAMSSMLTQAKDELQGRVAELANLQVRLSLMLTLTTAMLAIVSLWSQQRSSSWTVSLATIVACMVLGIALAPMRSNFKQAWINKHVDPIVWAVQAVDPLGKLCILMGATQGRNKIIARYKRVLHALVLLVWLVL